MTPQDDARLRDILDRVANALQPATLVSGRLRRALGQAAQDVIEIDAAINRAVRVLQRLQQRDER